MRIPWHRRDRGDHDLACPWYPCEADRTVDFRNDGMFFRLRDSKSSPREADRRDVPWSWWSRAGCGRRCHLPAPWSPSEAAIVARTGKSSEPHCQNSGSSASCYHVLERDARPQVGILDSMMLLRDKTSNLSSCSVMVTPFDDVAELSRCRPLRQDWHREGIHSTIGALLAFSAVDKEITAP